MSGIGETRVSFDGDQVVLGGDPSTWDVSVKQHWSAEWAPLREKIFCEVLARQIASALGAVAGLTPMISLTLNADRPKLEIALVVGGRGQGTAAQVEAILSDLETRRFWIWSAIDQAAYKGVAP